MKPNNFILIILLIVLSSCSKDNNTVILSTYFFNDAISDPFIDSLCAAQTHEVYLDYKIPLKCINEIYREDFRNGNNWYIGNDSRHEFNINSGKYIGECEDINFYVSCKQCNIHTLENFQIEIDVRILKNGNTCSLNWGSNNERNNIWHNTFRFGINGEGEYIIAQNENGGPIDSPVPLSNSTYINNNEVNKLTIRKVGNIHYFFINENQVKWLNNLELYGNFFSLRVGAHSKCEFDNIVLYEILR